MSAPPMADAALAALLVIPLIWSGLIAASRFAARQGGLGVFSDRAEKVVLAIMLAPVGLGVLALAAPAAPAGDALPLPLLDLEMFHGPAADVSRGAGVAPASSVEWQEPGLWLLAAIYVLGAARLGLKTLAAQFRFRRLAAQAAPAPGLPGVSIVDARVTPFASGCGQVIVPRVLVDALSPAQSDLIIAHERCHLRRGDVGFYALLAWIDVLFWINPFVRLQTRQCRLAAELACDAAATQAAPEMRKAYAEALVSALKHTAGDALACAPAVFSTRSVGEHRMRISEIMQSGALRRKRSALAVYVAAALLIAPAGALQLAYAQPAGGAVGAIVESVSVPEAGSSSAPDASNIPTAFIMGVSPLPGEVSSAYGPRTDPFNGQPAFHNGIDIRNEEGTPIVAPAGGRVSIARTEGGYGKLLAIEHWDGYTTRYAHLSAFEVSVGEQVTAGQVIGRVGSTGRNVGGPHLHLEVWRDGETVDPATVMPFSGGG